MVNSYIIKILIFILTISIYTKSFSQNKAINTTNKTLNIFIDCESCDINFFKKEINLINYVIKPKDADIHILITSQEAANRGNKYTFLFYGLNKFKNMNDTLIFYSTPNDTEYEISKMQVEIIKTGLIYYLSHVHKYDMFDINLKNKKNKKINDKWRSWVFDINLSTFLKDETSFKNISSWSNILAEKITNNIKIELNGHYDFSDKEYIIYDEKHETFNQSLNLNSLIVKSLNQHWSYGVGTYIGNSTLKNFKLNTNISSAIEYNIYPYYASTQKQLRFLFFTGYNYYKYNDTTIYNKIEENFFNEKLEIAYEIKQKWGNISAAINTLVYLPDYSKYILSLNTKSKIRIAKGFSLILSGGISLIHNQIYIPKGELSLEDILTKQKQQETNHLYWIKIGLSYTFGSKFNNIVNPRFGK